MNDLLSLEWDASQISGVQVHTAKGGVRIDHAFVLSREAPFTWKDDPREVGEWLKRELSSAGATAHPAVLAIPRELCVLRRVTVPAAPDEELPELVRLQAAVASSVPVDHLLIDFLALPQVADVPGRSLLVATLLRSRAEWFRKTLEAAGLEFRSLGLLPVALAELTARAEQPVSTAPRELSIAVLRQGRRIELSFVCERQLILGHETELHGDDAEQQVRQLVSEISRSLVALQPVVQLPIARCWLAGALHDDVALVDALVSRFRCETRQLNPLEAGATLAPGRHLPGELANFVGPIGMALVTAQPVVSSIDFLNPRRPPVKKDRRKLHVAAAAVALVALAVTGYVMLKLQESDLDRQIVERQKVSDGMNEVLAKGEPILKSAQAVAVWEDRHIDWLDRIRDLDGLLPGTERLYMSDFRVSPAAGDALAQLRATGFARDRRDVELLYQRCADAGYRVQPRPIQISTRDSDYPYRFELNLEIPAPAKPQPGTAPATLAGTL